MAFADRRQAWCGLRIGRGSMTRAVPCHCRHPAQGVHGQSALGFYPVSGDLSTGLVKNSY